MERAGFEPARPCSQVPSSKATGRIRLVRPASTPLHEYPATRRALRVLLGSPFQHRRKSRVAEVNAGDGVLPRGLTLARLLFELADRSAARGSNPEHPSQATYGCEETPRGNYRPCVKFSDHCAFARPKAPYCEYSAHTRLEQTGLEPVTPERAALARPVFAISPLFRRLGYPCHPVLVPFARPRPKPQVRAHRAKPNAWTIPSSEEHAACGPTDPSCVRGSGRSLCPSRQTIVRW